MGIVSYAQNFEDVMLWRALKNIENGFYIDVGANDPSVDSVTKAFYDRGWHGINIEPLHSHYIDLVAERPRDVNLHCAAGAANGEIEVWECDVRGWATAAENVVAQHTANGHAGTFHKVPLYRLTDICEEYVTGEINFLKIDVEGFEKAVIDGMDFSRFRPWILVIEATRPNSTEEIHKEWESQVLASGYVLAYADGLNRFYVIKDRFELLDSLHYPPNVFDEFVRFEQFDYERKAKQACESAALAEAQAQQANNRATLAEAQAQQANNRATLAEAQAQQANNRATLAEAQASNLDHALHDVYRSRSWRITAIVRYVGGFFRHMRLYFESKGSRKNQRPPNHWRIYVTSIARFASYRVMANPWLKRKALACLSKRPALRARLRRIVQSNSVEHFTQHDNIAHMLTVKNNNLLSGCHAASVDGTAWKQAEAVNGIQKTPLESYFY